MAPFISTENHLRIFLMADELLWDNVCEHLTPNYNSPIIFNDIHALHYDGQQCFKKNLRITFFFWRNNHSIFYDILLSVSLILQFHLVLIEKFFSQRKRHFSGSWMDLLCLCLKPWTDFLFHSNKCQDNSQSTLCSTCTAHMVPLDSKNSVLQTKT